MWTAIVHSTQRHETMPPIRHITPFASIISLPLPGLPNACLHVRLLERETHREPLITFRFGPSSEVDDPGRQCVWLAGETARAAAWQLGVQHINGCLRLQMNMLTQLDLDKASPVQPADEAVVAKLLSHAVRYSRASIRVRFP